MADKSKLLFIDTNILLDFYRCRNDAAISLLKHLDSIRDKIIMTYQVEMEFKKHRQNAILESFRLLKPPEQITRPGLFSDAKSFKAIQKNIKQAEERVKTLKSRLKKVFHNPTTQDEVYKVVQRLFTKEDDISLTRERKIRLTIRRRSWKRFLLGYPPRKQGDTSIGDALNWEWIIHCAIETGAEIVVLSRDSDYGVTLENESFLNDWLLQEFRNRVSQQRKIYLFNRASDALKLFKIAVTKEEREAESSITLAPATLQSTGTVFSPSVTQTKEGDGIQHQLHVTDFLRAADVIQSSIEKMAVFNEELKGIERRRSSTSASSSSETTED